MRPLWFVLPVALVAFPPAPAPAQVLYTVTDLGPGGASAINNAGKVAGNGPTTATAHAFRWSVASGMVDLGIGWGFGINASGQVTGENVFSHAYRTTPVGGNADPGADL